MLPNLLLDVCPYSAAKGVILAGVGVAIVGKFVGKKIGEQIPRLKTRLIQHKFQELEKNNLENSNCCKINLVSSPSSP